MFSSALAEKITGSCGTMAMLSRSSCRRSCADIQAVEADAALCRRRKSAAATGTAWSCRHRTGRPARRVSPGAMSSVMLSQRGRLRARRVAEADVLEADRRLPGLRQRSRRGGLDDGGFGVQQFQQALGRAGSAHHVAPHFRHGADAARHQDRVQDERRELAAGHGAVMHLVRADPQHENDGADHRGDDQRRHRRAHAGAPDRGDEARFRATRRSGGFRAAPGCRPARSVSR